MLTRAKTCDKIKKSLNKSDKQRTLITEQWNNLERFIENSEVIRIEMSSREQSRDESQSNLKNSKTFRIDEWLKLASWSWNGKNFLWEFDPGSGWTLAACLTHASRTKHFTWFPSGMIVLWLSGGRVSNAWITCLTQGDNSRKRLLIPHKRTAPHGAVWKTPVVWDGSASD